jgi:DnaD/phage-associated family protein
MKKVEKINIALNYGNSVSVLPQNVITLVDKAKKFDMKVLLLIASSEKYRDSKYAETIAKALECDANDVKSSVAFWNGAGVLTLVGAEEIKPTAVKVNNETEAPIAKRAKMSELPQYTSAELNSLLEKHHNVVELIDECQNILGKIFTASDIKVIMALKDYLGLDNDYILVLMHYAARIDKKTLRYIEQIAVSCMDEGFTDAKTLQVELYAREERAHIENKIKNVFGIGTRKLTAKEQKQINAWVNEYKYDLEVIERAYDITVSATSKPSIHYAHAILEKWYAEGIKTLSDVDAMLEKREQEKREEGSSFNVDEFFNAALGTLYSDKE